MSFVRNYPIEKILRDWKHESGAKNSIHYWYSIDGVLTICSSDVGKLIGFHGNLVFKYEQILKEQIRNFKEVKFQEVNYHYI